MSLGRAQLGVVIGMIFAAIVSYLVISTAYDQWRPDIELSAFALWGLCAAVAALALAAGVGAAANRRFFSARLIRGDAPTSEDAGFEITLRYIRNTSEQLLIFLCATAGLAATLPAEGLRLLPIAAAWFLVARAAFWIGYRLHPIARAFGFAATFYPNIAYLVITLWLGAASLSGE